VASRQPNRLSLDIPTATIFKVIIVGVLFYVAYVLIDVFIILLFSVIVVAAISPFVDWVNSKGVPRLVAITALYLVFFGLLGLFLSLVIPIITVEVNQLIQDLPNFISSLASSLEQAQSTSSTRYFDFFNDILNVLDTFSNYLATTSQSIVGFVVGLFGGVISFAAIVVISFYLSYMKNGVDNFIRAVIPDKYEPAFLRVWRRSEKKLGRWVQGQLLLALIVGLAVYVGLSLLGIPFALVLAILAMVLELVPNVGPVLAAVPAVILGFAQSSGLGFSVIVLYLIIQQIENHVLVPVVLGRTLGLNPVIVIVSLLIGAKLAGLIGVIIAVPVVAIIIEIFDEFSRQQNYKNSRNLSG